MTVVATRVGGWRVLSDRGVLPATCLAKASCTAPSIIALNSEEVGSICGAADSRRSGTGGGFFPIPKTSCHLWQAARILQMTSMLRVGMSFALRA